MNAWLPQASYLFDSPSVVLINMSQFYVSDNLYIVVRNFKVLSLEEAKYFKVVTLDRAKLF